MNKKFSRVGVCALIINKTGKVLLGKRHQDPQKADSELHGEGSWTLPGGKLEFLEKPKKACIRETLEETGIKIKKLEFFSVSNDMVPDAHFVTIGFLAKEFKGEPKVMEPDEITEWRWFNQAELPDKIFLSSRKALDNYFNKNYYHPDEDIDGRYAK